MEGGGDKFQIFGLAKIKPGTTYITQNYLKSPEPWILINFYAWNLVIWIGLYKKKRLMKMVLSLRIQISLSDARKPTNYSSVIRFLAYFVSLPIESSPLGRDL